MSSIRTLLRSACLLLPLSLALGQSAAASSLTVTGTLSGDDTTVPITLTVANPETYTLYTTSYGGGANLDGTVSIAGGFVPVLTLFSASGAPVGYSSACGGSAVADTATGLCNDAYLQTTLSSGSYTLVLSELPNVAVGSLSDGFLFAGNPSETGSLCGQAGASFLETDVAPCVQRTTSYAVNISSTAPVPEPPTWALVLPLAGVLVFAGRQQLS